jgi:hypothetical protein
MSIVTSHSYRLATVLALALCVVLAGMVVLQARQARALHAELAETAVQLERLKQPAPALAAADGQDAAFLRKLLQDRETAYNELRDKYQRLVNASAGAEASPLPPATTITLDSPNIASGAERGSYMERLRETDPERFRQIQQTREQWRQQTEKRLQEQLGRLDERIQNAASQEEVELLTALSESLVKIDEVRRGFETLRGLPGEERAVQARQLANQSMETYRQYSELRARDRELQLRQLATQIGYSDSNAAAQFVESVQRIYDETDAGLNRMLSIGTSVRERN